MRITKSIKRFHGGRYSGRTRYENIGKELTQKEHREVVFIKRQLINKNGAVCGICGKPITNMKDCTIDHIRPLSKGGITNLENCQLAHFECNLKKGNSI